MAQLGLVSISFRNLTPEIIIEEAKNTGLSCIEWGSDVHAPCNDIAALEKIAHLQKLYGISCCSYGTYFRLTENTTDELENYIKAAKILGTDILRIWCPWKDSAKYSAEDEKLLFEECRKTAALAEKHSVILSLECHNGTFTDNKDAAIKLLKTVNSPYMRMHWQPNQFLEIDESKKYARLVASFTKIIHVFNWTSDARFPLSGAVDTWKEYLSYFNKNQPLLLEFMPDDDISSLKAEAQALKLIAE